MVLCARVSINTFRWRGLNFLWLFTSNPFWPWQLLTVIPWWLLNVIPWGRLTVIPWGLLIVKGLLLHCCRLATLHLSRKLLCNRWTWNKECWLWRGIDSWRRFCPWCWWLHACAGRKLLHWGELLIRRKIRLSVLWIQATRLGILTKITHGVCRSTQSWLGPRISVVDIFSFLNVMLRSVYWIISWEKWCRALGKRVFHLTFTFSDRTADLWWLQNQTKNRQLWHTLFKE